MTNAGARTVVLIVEDEESYLDALSVGLATEGFSVVGAATIAEARRVLGESSPDLVLRDTSRSPVIIMSTRSSEVDVVVGLEMGAADYVTKPYRLRELVARMRAVLRRPVAVVEEPEIISFGELRIDLARRSVTRHDHDIELSRKEFDLLTLFATHLGCVVTREVCFDTLWWGLELSDTRTLDTHVKRLRRKIEDDPSHPRHLLTIRGVGFRLDP